MTAEPSPRPWRVTHPGEIEDANGELLYNLRDCIGGGVDEANAALIVAAVNKHGMPIVELIRGYDALKAERDRAVKYAEAAPHPGSAPWKEMQAVFAERDRLRDALNEVCHRVSVALNCPRHETEAIELLVHDLLGIKECARAAIGGEKQ